MKDKISHLQMLPKDTPESDSRLEVRVPGSMKSRFKTAAGIMGISLSDFVKTHLYEAANRIIAQEFTILSSESDKKLFYETLMHPPKPSKNLVKRAERYKKAQK